MDNRIAERKATVKSLVESDAYKGRFKQVLGEKAPQFVSSLVQISQSWQLAECEPNSVIAAAMTAAALDLPIDRNLGFAHIVPYGGKAQFQMGVKGYIQLGMRSGQYRLLNVTEVYDGELIKFDRVRAEVIIDQTKKASDKIVGYVAYMQLLNGFEHSEYWTMEMVKSHAEKFSQAYKKKKMDSPWFTNFDAMAKKTVVKAMLSHWGPMSIQMNKAIFEDQGVHTDVDTEVTYPDNEPPIDKPKFDGPEDAAPKKKELAKKEPPVVDVEESAAGLAPLPEKSEPATSSRGLPDFSNLYPCLEKWAKEDGISKEQIIAWSKTNRNSHDVLLCNEKSKAKEIMDLREDTVKFILTNWDRVFPLIKAVTV